MEVLQTEVSTLLSLLEKVYTYELDSLAQKLNNIKTIVEIKTRK